MARWERHRAVSVFVHDFRHQGFHHWVWFATTVHVGTVPVHDDIEGKGAVVGIGRDEFNLVVFEDFAKDVHAELDGS